MPDSGSLIVSIVALMFHIRAAAPPCRHGFSERAGQKDINAYQQRYSCYNYQSVHNAERFWPRAKSADNRINKVHRTPLAELRYVR